MARRLRLIWRQVQLELEAWWWGVNYVEVDPWDSYDPEVRRLSFPGGYIMAVDMTDDQFAEFVKRWDDWHASHGSGRLILS